MSDQPNEYAVYVNWTSASNGGKMCDQYLISASTLVGAVMLVQVDCRRRFKDAIPFEVIGANMHSEYPARLITATINMVEAVTDAECADADDD